MAQRRNAVISISVNGGTPGASDANVAHNSIVVLENTDRANIESYRWQIVSGPPGSSATLSAESWRSANGDYPTIETNATVLSLTQVKLPIRAMGAGVVSVKIPGDDTNYFVESSYLYTDNLTIKGLSLPGGTTEVLVVYVPENPATSFTADAYGTFIVELTLNRQLKGRVGASVLSPYLGFRLPNTDEQREFVGGWGDATYTALRALEDGYATVAAATGTGSVSGDLYGTLPDPIVVGLRGNPISSTPPASGQALAWNGSAWTPTTVSISVASGDLSGTWPDITVAKLQGKNIANPLLPTNSQVLAWNGITEVWEPTDPGIPAAHHDTHENGGSDEMSVAGLSGVLADAQNANQLQSRNVAATAPTSGQVLAWNGSAWAPAAAGGGAHTVGGAMHIADTLAGFNTKISDQNILGTLTSFGGDVSGTYSALTVIKLQGRSVAATAPDPGEVLTWNGSMWEPAAGGGGGGTTFVALTDTPSNYTNNAGALTVVNNGETALEFIRGTADSQVAIWDDKNEEWNIRLLDYSDIDGSPPAPEYVADRFLVFSDDTQFSTTSSTYETKKTFRICFDALPTGNYPQPRTLRFIAGLWITGGGTTAYVRLRINTVVAHEIILSTLSSSENVLSGDLTLNYGGDGIDEIAPDTIYTITIDIRNDSGTHTVNLKYTDIYLVY